MQRVQSFNWCRAHFPGSTADRSRFKSELQCKPFKWFLDNVYPDKFILDDPSHVFAFGRLKNTATNTCLDNLQNDDKDSYELGQYACHSFMAAAQFFSFSRNYELRREDACAQVVSNFPQRVEKVIGEIEFVDFQFSNN